MFSSSSLEGSAFAAPGIPTPARRGGRTSDGDVSRKPTRVARRSLIPVLHAAEGDSTIPSEPASNASAEAAAPKKKRPLPKRKGGESDESSAQTEPKLHPSWSIYEEEGNKCVICLGEGKTKCLFCFGDGFVSVGPQPDRDREDCPVCDAQQYVTCPRCEGSGVRPATRYDVRLRKMVRNRTNEEVRLGIGEDEDPAQVGSEAAILKQEERASAAEIKDVEEEVAATN